MTRKKWNRLRRQYPKLFNQLPSWESMTAAELNIMRPVGKGRAIAVMTAFKITHAGDFDVDREPPIMRRIVRA